MSASERGAKLVFADTNIWLYALLDAQPAEKSAKARAIIQQDNLVVSTQVINEVCVNLLKKAAFPEQKIQDLVNSFYKRHSVGLLDRECIIGASSLRTRHGFSFWDSMMISSALGSGAEIFYTEDMQNGMVVENSLRLINPFASQSTPTSAKSGN